MKKLLFSLVILFCLLPSSIFSEEQLLSLFSKGEKPERTPRHAKPTVDVKKKKEKGKNKNK
jgi:hypothetical protein